MQKWRILTLAAAVSALTWGAALGAKPPASSTVAMDRDLMEVTIPQLHDYYAHHRYTVSQVVDWYLNRIERYNGVYRPVEEVFAKDARAAAASADAEASGTPHGALWGVPMVIKANTSIAGKVTSDGWAGYVIPGHGSWRLGMPR